MSKPHELPPAGVVADMCAIRAWDQSIEQEHRLLFEMAADTIRAQVVDRMRAVNRAEQLEAECETYCAIIYGPQKGGAS